MTGFTRQWVAEYKGGLKKYNALLNEARAEAADIREKARAEGALILAELKDQATDAAEAITAKAHQQIEAERLAAADLKVHAVDGTDVADALLEDDAARDREVLLEPGQPDEDVAVGAGMTGRLVPNVDAHEDTATSVAKMRSLSACGR